VACCWSGRHSSTIWGSDMRKSIFILAYLLSSNCLSCRVYYYKVERVTLQSVYRDLQRTFIKWRLQTADTTMLVNANIACHNSWDAFWIRVPRYDITFQRHGFAFEEQRLNQVQKYVKNKAIPVTGRGGLYGYEMLRIPHCLDNRLTDGGRIVSLTHRQRTTRQKHYFSASGTRLC
jgi:hypothetical protein